MGSILKIVFSMAPGLRRLQFQLFYSQRLIVQLDGHTGLAYCSLGSADMQLLAPPVQGAISNACRWQRQADSGVCAEYEHQQKTLSVNPSVLLQSLLAKLF